MRVIAIVVLLVVISSLAGITVLHRYEFNGDLSDSIAGPDLIPIHTATSGFEGGAWNWTATSHPGGGLLLRTSLPNPEAYSLRMVFKFDDFYYSWTKIISFDGYSSTNHYFSSDHGLYFYYNSLEFYPYITNPNITFYPNIWYDLILTRTIDGLIRFYVTPFGQPQQLVLEFYDPDSQAVPGIYGDYNCWGLFYDDTWTTSEWTHSGSVALIEVWGQAYAFDAVQNPVITNSGSQISLSWDPFPDALSYNVYASDDPDSETWQLLGNTLNTNTTFSSTLSRKFYRIHAVLE